VVTAAQKCRCRAIGFDIDVQRIAVEKHPHSVMNLFGVRLVPMESTA
jgi:hypothetical protein